MKHTEMMSLKIAALGTYLLLLVLLIPISVSGVMISDNFDDSSINSAVWSTTGQRVRETAQEMRIEVTVMDDGGNLYLNPIIIDRENILTVSRRVRLHHEPWVSGKNYFMGQTRLYIGDLPRVMIAYGEMDSDFPPQRAVHGFYIARNGSSPHNANHDISDISERIEPVWDSWFTETIEYNPRTGDLHYYIDGDLRTTFNVGSMPRNGSEELEMRFNAWGWWTGHEHFMDDFTVSQDGLIAHYSFDGDAEDITGNGNHGVLYGPMPCADRFGEIGRALAFDGADHVIVPNPSILPQGEEFSISFWARFETLAGDRTIVDKRVLGGPSVGVVKFGLQDTDSTMRFETLDHSLSQARISLSTDNLSEGRWYHFVGVYDNQFLRFYIDGQLVGTDTASSTLNSTPANLWIGANNKTDDFNYFIGALDEFRIYDRPLSVTDIHRLFVGHSAEASPVAGYEHDGTHGPAAIESIQSGSDGGFSFVFGAASPGGQCIVSWTDTLRDWFPLLGFPVNSEGTEVSDPGARPQSFYRTTYLPAGVLPADRFDYPFGDGSPAAEGIPEERNNIYPDAPVVDPPRSGAGSGTDWYNISDVGNYVTFLEDGVPSDGLHPGEDWNYGGIGDDVALPVRCAANGQVVDIRPIASKALGWSITVRHTLLNGDNVYTIYNHVAPTMLGGAENTSGAVGEESDFQYAEESPVLRGDPIALIADIAGSHLHFELRYNVDPTEGLRIWTHDLGNGYYGPVAGGAGSRPVTITPEEVESAFVLMQQDGIRDPSDFIDDHR